MDLGEAILSRLTGAAAVTDIVGSGADARTFWVRRDQESGLPALVLQQVGGPPEEFSLEGNSDFQESLVQASCLAGSHIEAHALAAAFVAALMPAADVSGFLFWDADDAPRPIDRGGDVIGGGFIYEVTQELVLRHSRSI